MNDNIFSYIVTFYDFIILPKRSLENPRRAICTFPGNPSPRAKSQKVTMQKFCSKIMLSIFHLNTYFPKCYFLALEQSSLELIKQLILRVVGKQWLTVELRIHEECNFLGFPLILGYTGRQKYIFLFKGTHHLKTNCRSSTAQTQEKKNPKWNYFHTTNYLSKTLSKVRQNFKFF